MPWYLAARTAASASQPPPPTLPPRRRLCSRRRSTPLPTCPRNLLSAAVPPALFVTQSPAGHAQGGAGREHPPDARDWQRGRLGAPHRRQAARPRDGCVGRRLLGPAGGAGPCVLAPLHGLCMPGSQEALTATACTSLHLNLVCRGDSARPGGRGPAGGGRAAEEAERQRQLLAQPLRQGRRPPAGEAGQLAPFCLTFSLHCATGVAVCLPAYLGAGVTGPLP